MSLREYKRKRDFSNTAEPLGSRGKGRKERRFVIQKHAASRLHYDFRLEIDGTLKSWAVPKGVPFKKGEKRLAVEVEDHPVSYIDFEGTIPKGQYGGGTVMVWDHGTFESPAQNPSQELKGGKLHVTLTGTKLRGEWYLVRLRDGNQWLLIKGGEDLKPISKTQDDTSARSGQSMAQLGRSSSVWKSKSASPLRRLLVG
jgi:bifunctional non-homologous end joining protein LigD